MRVLCWHGTGDVRVDTVADPKIEHLPRCGNQNHRVCHLLLRPSSIRRPPADHSGGDILG
jgi:hypothetical protein